MVRRFLRTVPHSGSRTAFEIIQEAREAWEAGESFHRRAAQLMAEARCAKATMEQIADGIGKSVSWVSDVLAWWEGGCKGTVFGKKSDAARLKRKFRSTENVQRSASLEAQQELADAKARAEAAKAEAAAVRARASQARAEAREARARAATAKSNERAAHAETAERLHRAFGNVFGAPDFELPASKRKKMVGLLDRLGSEHPGERDSAACALELERQALGVYWGALVIPATDGEPAATRDDLEDVT